MSTVMSLPTPTVCTRCSSTRNVANYQIRPGPITAYCKPCAEDESCRYDKERCAKEQEETPPTYRTSLEQVTSRDSEGIPHVRMIEIVTDGDEEFHMYPQDTDWSDLSVEDRQAWSDWLQATHDFEVRLAGEDPCIRDAFDAHPEKARISDGDWESMPGSFDGLLDEILEGVHS